MHHELMANGGQPPPLPPAPLHAPPHAQPVAPVAPNSTSASVPQATEQVLPQASQPSESLPDLLLLPHLPKKRLKPEISMYFIARIGLLYVESFVQNAKSFLLTLASVVAIPCLPRPVSVCLSLQYMMYNYLTQCHLTASSSGVINPSPLSQNL